jgi:hypothetical protein
MRNFLCWKILLHGARALLIAFKVRASGRIFFLKVKKCSSEPQNKYSLRDRAWLSDANLDAHARVMEFATR